MRKLSAALALASLLLCLPALGKERPSKFHIENVAQVAQLDYTGCGAAALTMLLGQCGPPVDYKEVVDVVRSMARGTSLPDMVRGGHFSRISAAVSEAYPGSQSTHGYSARPLGWGAFFFASRTPWLDELKDVIAAGYPVAVLTDWKPGESGPHYRVVTGYDDQKGVFYLHDPWPYGTSLQSYHLADSGEWAWPYADFLAVWSLSTQEWGLEGGYRYGAVVSAPWKVRVQLPATVRVGEPFTLTAQVEYCCPPPFGKGPDGTFPSFAASEVQFELELPAGVRGAKLMPIGSGILRAGEISPSVTFQLEASQVGPQTVTVKASGRVRGHVPTWGTTYWKQAYDYTDLIGGEQAATVTVRPKLAE